VKMNRFAATTNPLEASTNQYKDVGEDIDPE
jgi:hypothetical protein